MRILYRSNETNGKEKGKTCNDESDDVVVTLEKKYFKVAHTSFQPKLFHDKVMRKQKCFQTYVKQLQFIQKFLLVKRSSGVKILDLFM